MWMKTYLEALKTTYLSKITSVISIYKSLAIISSIWSKGRNLHVSRSFNLWIAIIWMTVIMITITIVHVCRSAYRHLNMLFEIRISFPVYKPLYWLNVMTFFIMLKMYLIWLFAGAEGKSHFMLFLGCLPAHTLLAFHSKYSNASR